MLHLSGYKILNLLHSGSSTVIYRALKAPQTPVIIKTHTSSLPTVREIARLKHEYELTKNLEIPGIVKPLELIAINNSLAIIYEDFGGRSLQGLVFTQGNEIKSFLTLAIQLVETITQLHKQQIVHKDIKPSNIIIHLDNLQVKITDFSIASRLETEKPVFSNTSNFEGTLAYMSPEQTGRMNRIIDYRSDFYSLGVTLYELLTGNLPFTAIDPMELIHCHIAIQPVPPNHRNKNIPQTISDIVMKLLAKTAEERYQSGQGLKADLESCLFQLQAGGEITNITVGHRDYKGQFTIPQKLYGREQEVETLITVFERVAQCKTSEMILVSGYSGIGKSALVNEIHKPIVGARGYFISGKFDQFKRNIPYASLVQAFQSLIRQILTENAIKIKAWKEKILLQLGDNISLINEIIPEVELIVGQQPSVSQLSPTESENRFNLVFKKFLHIFANKKHPLVLFLDDLQWADSASLKLIKLIMTDLESQYFLLVGAYRDNEVSTTHSLIQTIDEIRTSGVRVNKIDLHPLDLNNTIKLINDTFNKSSLSTDYLENEEANLELLAEVIFQETQGNPFFSTQILNTLYRDNLLFYNFSIDKWEWDIKKIQQGLTNNNVVELIAKNINQLPEASQKVLKLAACIGNRFSLDVLAVVNEKSTSETALDLWSALQVGLVVPYGGSDYKIPMIIRDEKISSLTISNTLEINVEYKFLHDRVQQAAYSLILEADKAITHLKIGQLLLINTSKEHQEGIFDLVNQLNLGRDLVNDEEKRIELANLNLIAGRKAKVATAYETAIQYLLIGLEMLPSNSWRSRYDLTLAIYVESVESAYLSTNYELSETLSNVALNEVTNFLDRIKIYELKIQFYMAQSRMIEAVDLGLSVLKLLNVPLSIPKERNLVVQLPSLTDLETFPSVQKPEDLAAMRLLMTIAPPAYFAKPEILPPIILTLVTLCIERGHSPIAAYAYGFYGVVLCGATKELEIGYHAGMLALRLLEIFQAKELKAKVYTQFNSCIRPWKEHLKETLLPFRESIQSGLETGDIEWASYSAMTYCAHIFLVGEPLETVKSNQVSSIDLLLKLKQESTIYYAKIWHQLTLNLAEKTENPYVLTGDIFQESQIPLLETSQNYTSLFMAYLAKIILSYLFKDYASACKSGVLSVHYLSAVVGMATVGSHNFYYSLSLLACYLQVNEREQQQYLEQVTENQKKMQQWALSAPCNYLHKYHLVEAEKARIFGDIVRAMEYYDRAIAGAKEFGYIQEEAIANERAADFYLALGREKVARTYLIDAYYNYVHWGAVSKVKDLEAQYPQLLNVIVAQENPSILPIQKTAKTTTTTSNNLSGIDLETVMKASLALSSEIVLEQLITKLMKIVIENAGAQTGFLIVERGGNLAIEAAEGTTELEKYVTIEDKVPLSAVNYAISTLENIVLDNAVKDELFGNDPYIIKNKPKSVLCAPLIKQGKLIGILYLENNLTPNAFSGDRLEILKLLCSQAAISLENATLVANLAKAKEELENYNQSLEEKVKERTKELKTKNRDLKNQANQLKITLKSLKETQIQLIQSEKMSSLGQLVAGVAHEINNPVNFIHGNLVHAQNYINNLLGLLHLYAQHYPNPVPEIKEEVIAIDLDFLQSDFTKLMSSMDMGTKRIQEIVHSLRNFSRLDEAQNKAVDLHEGIDSTLLILQSRLSDQPQLKPIEIIKEYGELPLINCYAGQLNQVFMNLLSNGIDAIREKIKSEISNSDFLGTIHLRTWVKNSQNQQVVIEISDNGIGMNASVRQQLFNPFFTTKPVGKGTGLGLAVSYSIIVNKHLGQIECHSKPGEGTTFILTIPIHS